MERAVRDRIRILGEETLSDDWGRLKKTSFEYRRLDGVWEKQARETYDRGNGATVIPFDATRRTVLLVRQFRFPAYVTGHSEPLLEACAGLLDADDPETCIRREAEEELGYRLRDVRMIFMPFMSPGSLTERLAFFTASYSPSDRIAAGGGSADEGEDIEVVELTLDQAYAGIGSGEIVDAKTIILLQHLMIVENARP